MKTPLFSTTVESVGRKPVAKKAVMGRAKQALVSLLERLHTPGAPEAISSASSELATSLGYDELRINATTAYKWKDGAAFPTVPKLPGLAKGLNITIADLFKAWDVPDELICGHTDAVKTPTDVMTAEEVPIWVQVQEILEFGDEGKHLLGFDLDRTLRLLRAERERLADQRARGPGAQAGIDTPAR